MKTKHITDELKKRLEARLDEISTEVKTTYAPMVVQLTECVAELLEESMWEKDSSVEMKMIDAIVANLACASEALTTRELKQTINEVVEWGYDLLKDAALAALKGATST